MDKLDAICRDPTEEVLTKEKLGEYIGGGTPLKHYIGYEISGFVHVGILITASKIADFQKAGVDTTIFLADYHSWMNKKLGGDLSTIRRIGGGYFKEALKQCLDVVGGNSDDTNYVMGSELYAKKGADYLDAVLKVAMGTQLARLRRSITIMGRREGDLGSSAQLMYPLMQVADIFALNVNLAHAGMDQRKAHVIALEVGEEVAGYKPVAVHNHLLMGMHLTEEMRQNILKARKEGNRELFEDTIMDIKMSKSKPESAIFIHDTPDEITKKINKAYCPASEVELNPLLELVRYLLMSNDRELEITSNKLNTKKNYTSYRDLEKDYSEGKIHPADLKEAASGSLIELLEPARRYFLEGNGKKYLDDMRGIKVGR
jgi:tyrosyl-tRNA synthetase